MWFVNLIALLIIVGCFVLGAGLVYGTLRKQPPFKPGEEPKHYWED